MKIHQISHLPHFVDICYACATTSKLMLELLPKLLEDKRSMEILLDWNFRRTINWMGLLSRYFDLCWSISRDDECIFWKSWQTLWRDHARSWYVLYYTWSFIYKTHDVVVINDLYRLLCVEISVRYSEFPTVLWYKSSPITLYGKRPHGCQIFIIL